jgi:hypothetical protein
MDLPKGYRETKCIYNQEGSEFDRYSPKEAHSIIPDGRIEQEFTAPEPYIWWIDVITGYQPNQKPGPVELALLNEDRDVLARNPKVSILNNRQTIFRFLPVKVTPGKRYWIRLINNSGITLGVYMRYIPGVNGEHRKPPDTGATLVYGERNVDDGEGPDVLVGCAEGAQRVQP